MKEMRSEAGFTLVELLLAVAILAIIAVPLSMGFITGLRFVGRTDEKFNDSRSALISAAYFSGDVAGANTIVPNDLTACGGGTAVVSFGSSDATGGVSAPVNNEVSYIYDTSDVTDKKLVRKYCPNGGTQTRSTAAVSLASSPVITCYDAGGVVSATCTTARWVKMMVTQKANAASPDNPSPVSYSFTLEGTRRPS